MIVCNANHSIITPANTINDNNDFVASSQQLTNTMDHKFSGTHKDADEPDNTNMRNTADVFAINAEHVISDLSNAAGTLDVISKPTRVDKHRNITAADQIKSERANIDDKDMYKRE